MFGRFKKSYINYRGESNKMNLLKNLDRIVKKIPTRSVQLNVVSMSGQVFYEDQLLSLFSFYHNVGIPSSWIIYNDGTYNKQALASFEKIPNVHVKCMNSDKYQKEVEEFPTLNKMFILQDIVPLMPTIFTDSDILFFPSFLNELSSFIYDNCYLVDESNLYFDPSIPLEVDTSYPLNLGFLLLNKRPDWNIAWQLIEKIIASNALHYWTDQTAMHILAIQEKFIPLPKDKFVVGGKDAFTLKDAFKPDKIALRHYVGPIRHKMWQHNYQKLLGL